MKPEEFKRVRHYLDKTQVELARMLAVSAKSVQSYEQGWRTVPSNVEMQLTLLVSLKNKPDIGISQCWDVRHCPQEWREKCVAWEFKVGHFCWFINGTFCNGRFQNGWDEKIELCKKCEVLQSAMPSGLSY